MAELLWGDDFYKSVEAVRSDKTADNYERAARHFVTFLEKAGVEVKDAPPDALIRFTQWLITEKKAAPQTVYVYVIGACNYVHFLKTRGLDLPEFHQPKMPKAHKAIRFALTQEQLQHYARLGASFPEPYATAILLLPVTGFRIEEMCSLRGDDLERRPWRASDGSEGHRIWLHARETKGKRDRVVPLPREGEAVLIRYLRYVRPTLRADPWLFPGRQPNGHISKRSMETYMVKLRDAIGVRKLTPHTLRHTFLSDLAEKDVDTFTLMELAGHADITTTQQYIHTRPGKLLESVDRLNASYLKGD